MIITTEVQDVLDNLVKMAPEEHQAELRDAAVKTLEGIDKALGDSLERWYGALVTQSFWIAWFKDMCMAWPGGLDAAFEFLPGPEAIMLVDVFLWSHPLAKTAMTKFGAPWDAQDIATPEQQEELQAILKRQMAGRDPRGGPQMVKVDGDLAKQLVELLRSEGVEIPGEPM